MRRFAAWWSKPTRCQTSTRCAAAMAVAAAAPSQ
jgi:hypothetical protein